MALGKRTLVKLGLKEHMHTLEYSFFFIKVVLPRSYLNSCFIPNFVMDIWNMFAS
jgi:hypothetical protein